MDNVLIKILIFYFVLINGIAFITMHIDKKRAETHKWRIPEARLFLFASMFGSPGILAGMKIFRHKTKHMKFVIGIPCILIIQILIVYFTVNHFKII